MAFPNERAIVTNDNCIVVKRCQITKLLHKKCVGDQHLTEVFLIVFILLQAMIQLLDVMME